MDYGLCIIDYWLLIMDYGLLWIIMDYNYWLLIIIDFYGLWIIDDWLWIKDDRIFWCMDYLILELQGLLPPISRIRQLSVYCLYFFLIFLPHFF